VSPARRKNLFGTWKGLVYPQEVPNVPTEFRINYIFHPAHEKSITGEMSFTSWDKSRGVIENYMIGGFVSDNDLEFIYAKKQDRIIGWGSVLLKMSHDARKLIGHVVGVSSHTGEPFHAKVMLTKGKICDLRDQSGIKPKNPTIFIGHGRNKAWIKLKNYLKKRNFTVEAFESGARAGKLIYPVIEGMVADASFALLIMTGEDKTDVGKPRARQNVIHEIGLCQGRFGPNRAIVLLEDDVEEFTNMSGIGCIPFEKNKIHTCFREVVATIKREFPKINKKSRSK